jgi:recombination protein RecR
VRGRPDDARALADALREVKERITPCKRCFNLTEAEKCDICTDSRRDQSVICVVEDPYDIGPIERTGEYRGLYHVLGGALSPLDGIEPEDLRIAELVERVEREGTKEIVIATNPNTTGEATALFIAQELKDMPVRVTALASGLPVGGDLEYADEVTLGRAFAGRREI